MASGDKKDSVMRKKKSVLSKKKKERKEWCGIKQKRASSDMGGSQSSSPISLANRNCLGSHAGVIYHHSELSD